LRKAPRSLQHQLRTEEGAVQLRQAPRSFQHQLRAEEGAVQLWQAPRLLSTTASTLSATASAPPSASGASSATIASGASSATTASSAASSSASISVPAPLLIPSKSLSVSASTLTAIYLTICSISEISFSISNRQHLQLLQHHLQQQLQLHISTSIDSINITISMYLNLPEDFVHRFHW